MTRYRITHNGMDIEGFDSFEAAEDWMAEQIEEYRHLEPKEIYRSYGADNQATHPLETIKSVIIWQYRTMYTEVFMIEEIKY